jgi:hypothetical protein
MAQALRATTLSVLVSQTPPFSKSEKFPNIESYDGEMDKFDAWEQSLIQRMYINHDRYPIQAHKIAYAESKLTFRKRAYNLMRQYRVNGLCTIPTLKKWRTKFRDCCNNRFEKEDFRKYLRDTLKQISKNFDEYYSFFAPHVARSRMEDLSLIEYLFRGLNYKTLTNTLSYRKFDGSESAIFEKYITIYRETDWKFRQIEYIHPKQAFTI